MTTATATTTASTTSMTASADIWNGSVAESTTFSTTTTLEGHMSEDEHHRGQQQQTTPGPVIPGSAAGFSSLPDSSLEAASAIIKALFGSSVGPCWGDFFCTHNRIRGRLYASSLAILFYSNLLGFERRICLRFREIKEMALYRTTSIRIVMHDSEVYVFRSFNDRVQVLHVLKGLKILAVRKLRRRGQHQTPIRTRSTSSHALLATPSSETASASAVIIGTDTPPTLPTRVPSRSLRATLSSSLVPGPAPLVERHRQQQRQAPLSAVAAAINTPARLTLNRRRSASDSLLQEQQHGDEDGSMTQYLSESDEHAFSGRDLFAVGRGGGDGAGDDDASAHMLMDDDEEEDEEDDHEYDGEDDVGHEESVQSAWMKTKDGSMAYTVNVGIQNLVLPISLEKFFSLFLADDAAFSLDYYQGTVIGDKDITMTAWIVDEREDVLKRSIIFTHPIKNSYGVGPSEARTKREQRLRRFQHYGISVENTTVCEGIPSADAFFVQDHWIIEATKENEITLSTRFGSRFTKRAFFRGLIEKNIIKETQEWLAGYSEMLRDAMEEKKPLGAGEPSMMPIMRDGTLIVAPITELLERIVLSLNRTTAIAAVLLLFLSLILVFQLLVMRETISLMREEIRTLREEVAIVITTCQGLVSAKNAKIG